MNTFPLYSVQNQQNLLILTRKEHDGDEPQFDGGGGGGNSRPFSACTARCSSSFGGGGGRISRFCGERCSNLNLPFLPLPQCVWYPISILVISDITNFDIGGIPILGLTSTKINQIHNDHNHIPQFCLSCCIQTPRQWRRQHSPAD